MLDIDYTLFDMKCQSNDVNEMMRPYVIPFIQSVFPYYDIAIWSQTHWTWLEMKLTEMGLLMNPEFYITFGKSNSEMKSHFSKKSVGQNFHV